MTEHESSDALWDEFVREYAKNDAKHEPSAAERAMPPKAARPRRSRSSWLVPATVALVVAAGAVGYLIQRPSETTPAAAPPAASASPRPTDSSGSASARPPAGRATGTAAALAGSSAPTAGAATGAAARPTQAVPLSVFPHQYQGYTLVADTTNSNCTGSDTVAPTLAGMITQSHGCLGVDLAIYKDADNNQYNLVLFTMKDPVDAFDLTSWLGRNAAEYEVAVQLPPDNSGLRQLPADSGLVQTFGSYGNVMLVGMAQWSDGRTADFNKLVQQLTPLTDTVMKGIEV